MPDRLSMHAPVLVNTLGHCAGAMVFGILLYFLLIDWRRDPRERSPLPAIAAGLALLWNAGSLVGIATLPGNVLADAIVAASFSVLSLLPALLLHISLARWNALTIGGYVVSVLAVTLHIVDLLTGAPRFHYAAILLITIGFGTLTVIALAQELVGRHQQDGSGKRLAGAMVLFLLAISFVHFRANHDSAAWSGEVALHHAGIPLALFVILQDYRFLLVDAFVRFLVNAGLAAATVWAALTIQARFAGIAEHGHPVYLGLEFVGACLLLSLFAFGRNQSQRVLTKLVFMRSGAEQSLQRLSVVFAGIASDSEFLRAAVDIVAETASARRVEIEAEAPSGLEGLRHVTPILDPIKYGCPAWVQAVAPLRLSRGDVYFLYLGSRSGGRRYLSEDIELLDRVIAMMCERIERMRNSEMQNLVTQAELRALQAQINPHFFFNALNTLYGTIPRESATARRLVVNLADLFRVSFASERTTIRIEEEIRIVRAYLEIEQLRLGSRLRTEIDIDDDALRSEVPVLSIQPLVENAVKHGVAARTGGGFVQLIVRANEGSLTVAVKNTGSFQPESGENRGTGVGLSNVRRRLVLCFGEDARLNIISENEMTTVSFSVRRQASVSNSDKAPAGRIAT